MKRLHMNQDSHGQVATAAIIAEGGWDWVSIKQSEEDMLCIQVM